MSPNTLDRIFHTDRDEETAKADGVPPAAQEAAGRTALTQPQRGETSFRQANQRLRT